MRRRHFETLAPICPVCRSAGRPDAAVEVAFVEGERGDDILAGGLECPAESCRREFPIVDGIPYLVPDVPAFVSAQAWSIHERRNLPPGVASLLGDASGPDSPFETNRRQVGSYAADHYADRLDLGRSSLVDLFDTLLASVAGEPAGPRLDAGCAVGRTTFELAERAPGELVLGIDANVAMLRPARELLTTGRTDVPLRRGGVVHERRTIEHASPAAEAIDFWACDALALPFRESTFGLATAFNLLDCVTDPPTLLTELGRALRPGGWSLLTTPYDWSTTATPVGSWIGGHSQRSPLNGDGPATLRTLLEAGVGGLRIAAEFDRLPWRVRVHDRSTMLYDVHGLVLERPVG